MQRQVAAMGTVPIEAGKTYLDSKGRETKAPLSEAIEVGLFAKKPGSAALKPTEVIAFRTVPVTSGRSVATFVVDRKPAFASVDP